MQFFVYIIYSHTLDKFYIGYTVDVGKRLNEHNAGISTFTSKAEDWVTKWTKAFETREEAMAEERRIKKKKSRRYIEWLISNFNS